MSIGIIGHGAFGAFLETLAQRYLPSARVRIYSRHDTPDRKRFFTLEETCSSSVVVFAVPISAFEEALTSALPHLSADSILIDVATVKAHTSEILRRLAGDHPYVASHPMFGPESYAKREGDVTGFRIVLAEHTLSPDRYAAAVASLRERGFDVVLMSPDEHDRRLAETLFLTHFVGQTVARAGFARTDIDTVSFGYLMQAVESVKNDTKLFEDVFRFNAYCKAVLDRFEVSEKEVRALLEKGSH